MSHYQNLGTLSVRWMAVGFFVLAFVTIVVGGTMAGAGSMMGGGAGRMSDHMGGMMQGGGWLWWGGPTLLNLIIGFVLYAVSGPVGRAMASGLEREA